MSFKTILAVVNFESDLKASLASAIQIARLFDAHLTVLLVSETEPLPFYGYGGKGFTDIWVKEGEERATALTEATEKVEHLLEIEGLSFDVRARQSVVAREDNLVARHAIYADLAIICRAQGGELDTVETQAIDGALFDSGRPLLFVPFGKEPVSLGKNILVAWNSRREAAEAVSHSLPLLMKANTVTLLVADPEVGPEDHGEVPGADMALVLARHGIEVDVRVAESNGREIADVLQEEAAGIGADLIVMGAYGHSRMRENILGGTTRDMLEDCRVPLFLAH